MSPADKGPDGRIRNCGRYGRVVQFDDSSYVFEKPAPVQAWEKWLLGLVVVCVGVLIVAGAAHAGQYGTGWGLDLFWWIRR